jgi:hypothetical protein
MFENSIAATIAGRRDRTGEGSVKRSQQRTASATEPGEGSDHVERRAEIRDQARDTLVRHGRRKATSEDAGKACGLGRAALHSHSSGKEENSAEVARRGRGGARAPPASRSATPGLTGSVDGFADLLPGGIRR